MESIEDYLNLKSNTHSQSLTRKKVNTNISIQTTGYKHNYPILEYQEKFKNNFMQMKGSLANINANITNYKQEIEKLEEFLIKINEHETNHKKLIKRLTGLKEIMEETIEKESLISKLSSNQQIINISEYVKLYQRVKDIINYFKNSNLNESSDFAEKMRQLMYSGFKVYEESFYAILKRYESLENNQKTEMERMNLLNKIELLAECLQDAEINYDFTQKLIDNRKENIIQKLDDARINVSKNLNENNYTKNSGIVTNFFILSEKLYQEEREYINKILKPCSIELKSFVYLNIIEPSVEKILQNLKEIVNKHNKSSSLQKIDFYQNFDIVNIWHEKTKSAYKDLIEKHDLKLFANINALILLIEDFCVQFVNNFIEEIETFNEKIENENVLKICNETFFFLSTFLKFETAFEFVRTQFQAKGNRLSIGMIVGILIKKIESKAVLLDKKYPPLKFIFLLNNVFFIQSKVTQKPISKFTDENLIEMMSNKIKNYVENYVIATWKKVDEITFNEKDNILLYESDGKILKNSSKQNIKKKFSNFNETMKINLKFQQNIQIIDSSLEKMLIEANIDKIAKQYEEFYLKYANCGFTKFRNKYITYGSGSDVIQDLKIYFMPSAKINK
jgi:hypothetical protein